MNQMFNRWLVAASVALFAVGCAQSNGDINRVQPNVMRKSDLLDGVWYFRNTVTWTPATTGFTFTGETGNLEKLVFEIQEKYLIGYRAYPYTLGADPNVDPNSRPSGTTARFCTTDGACAGGQKYYGSPVVAYSIQSHFDIQRSYSTSSGEPGNVISENGSDRVWNQREYIRVDWSANLLNKSGEMGWNTLQNPAGGTDYNAWIQPNEPGTDRYDWPTREYGADGKLSYMDFTGRYMAWPDLYYFEGQGYYPLCFLTSRYDCTSAEIRMRTSLSKVDPKVTNDYEPLVYGNDLMSKFGYFRTERLNYDRKFGATESARVFLANRHRIWKSAFEKDANGEPDQTRPLPFASREAKPVVYYLTPASRLMGQSNYDEIRESAKILERNWDRAFRRAVAAAQQKAPDQVGQMLHICDNPVPAGAPADCGPEGYEAKMGDLRRSFLYTVTDPVPNGLLGYGPSSTDPETGETISANANTYSAAVDTYAKYGLDIMDAIVGRKTADDLISGADVIRYMQNNPGYAQGKPRRAQALQAELQGIASTAERSIGAFERPTERVVQLLDGLKASGGLPVASVDRAKAAAEILEQHPQLEAALLDNPEVAADVVHLLPPALQGRAMEDKDFARRSSRRVLTRVNEALSYQQDRVEWASRRNIYLAEFLDRPVLGLATRENQKRTARELELRARGHQTCKGPMISETSQPSCSKDEAEQVASAESLRRLRQAIWRATAEHEFGHTLGLRHNFQGSFDAINYFDQFWKIRQSTLTVQQSGQAKIPRTPADLRAASDGLEEQLVAGLHDYQYSSIMDYGGKFNADFAGVGKYDEAAIIFAYSGGRDPGYVEVFQAGRATEQSFPGSDGKTVTVTGAAVDLPIVNAAHRHPGVPNYTERYHYALAPLHFGTGSDVEAVFADGINKLGQRKLMKWADVKKENDRLAALIRSRGEAGITASDVGNAPMEVPYMFCTDGEVGGVLSCNRFDAGPDYFEMARNYVEDYWNSYYWTHFRRDRAAFGSSSAFNTSANTFVNLSNIYKNWVHAMYGQRQAGQQNLPRYTLDPNLQDTWSMAVFDGANANLAVMSVAPIGFYMYRNLGGVGRWDVVNEGIDFDQLTDEGKRKMMEYYSDEGRWSYPAQKFATLPRGFGRKMYSRYDYKSGFGFFNRMLEVGHYNDQLGAMIASVLPQARFLGVDAIADQNRYNIPYYLVFKNEFGEHFGALWSNDEEVVRPTMYLTLDSAGQVTEQPDVTYKTVIEGKNFVRDFNYPKRTDIACSGGQTQGCLRTTQFPAPANIQLTWTSRIYGLYLGMALFSVNYDLDYAKANLVYKVGSGEQVQIPTGYHALEVQDVTTGARYVTPEKDGAEINSTPAVRMINVANAYLQAVKDPTMCPMPTIPSKFGGQQAIDSCMSADEVRNPWLVEQRRREYTEYFRDNIRDLDLMRGFYQAFGRAF